jgi:glycosyltransferase involved in cell wall biosynthesis
MVVPSLRGGGLERVVTDLTIAIQGRGWDPAVFGVDGLGVHEATLRARGIPCFDCREGRWRIRGVPLRLLRAINDWNPAIIHAHSGTWLPSAVVKTLRRRTALVFTDHGRYPPEPRARAIIERWCAQRTDRLLAVSAATSDYVKNFLGLRTAPEVIENGISLAPYQAARANRSRMREVLGVTTEEKLLIAVGRLVPVKNHRLLLEAFAAARAKLPALRLAIIGSGALEAELKSFAEGLGLGNDVRFLGYRDDIPDCLAASDVFVNSSTTEGLPISLLEAMAAGLPVIATSVGGVPQVLGPSQAGVLVPSGDGVAMAAAMVALSTNSALLGRLSRSATAAAEAYSLERCAERHAALYESLLRQG